MQPLYDEGQQEADKELLTKGCEFYGSEYESTGLGDVDERCASLERFGKTPANLFPHDPRGKPCG